MPVRLRPPGSVAGPAAQWQSPGLRREQIGDRRVGFALLRAAVSSDPLAGLRRVSVLGSAQSLAPDPPGRVGVAGGHREGVVPVPLRETAPAGRLAGLLRVSVLGSARSLVSDPPGWAGVAGGHREGVVPVPLRERAPAGRLAGLLRVSVLGSARSLVPGRPGRAGLAGGHRVGVEPVPLWETAPAGRLAGLRRGSVVESAPGPLGWAGLAGDCQAAAVLGRLRAIDLTGQAGERHQVALPPELARQLGRNVAAPAAGPVVWHAVVPVAVPAVARVAAPAAGPAVWRVVVPVAAPVPWRMAKHAFHPQPDYLGTGGRCCRPDSSAPG